MGLLLLRSRASWSVLVLLYLLSTCNGARYVQTLYIGLSSASTCQTFSSSTLGGSPTTAGNTVLVLLGINFPTAAFNASVDDENSNSYQVVKSVPFSLPDAGMILFAQLNAPATRFWTVCANSQQADVFILEYSDAVSIYGETTNEAASGSQLLINNIFPICAADTLVGFGSSENAVSDPPAISRLLNPAQLSPGIFIADVNVTVPGPVQMTGTNTVPASNWGMIGVLLHSATCTNNAPNTVVVNVNVGPKESLSLTGNVTLTSGNATTPLAVDGRITVTGSSASVIVTSEVAFGAASVLSVPSGTIQFASSSVVQVAQGASVSALVFSVSSGVKIIPVVTQTPPLGDSVSVITVASFSRFSGVSQPALCAPISAFSLPVGQCASFGSPAVAQTSTSMLINVPTSLTICTTTSATNNTAATTTAAQPVLSTTAIIIIAVVGGVVVLAAIGAIIGICIHKHREKREMRNLSNKLNKFHD